MQGQSSSRWQNAWFIRELLAQQADCGSQRSGVAFPFDFSLSSGRIDRMSDSSEPQDNDSRDTRKGEPPRGGLLMLLMFLA